MLVFDDNMLKQRKMYEALLRITAENRQENLKKYKDIVVKIDKQAFTSLLDELKQIDNHNQILDDELQFMKEISNYYNELCKLQQDFKNVCELYGDNELELSDLSQINIDYIERRKDSIDKYLKNLEKLEENKQKLEILNEKLVDEERKKIHLRKELLEYEDKLRKNFIYAEGRIVIDGKLQYVSIVSEYRESDYDFKLLLDNKDVLFKLLSKVTDEKNEIEEKYRTAGICYNSNPNSSSKCIFDDIGKEFFKVRYRETLLKILKLLANDCDDYEQFKEKRRDLLNLIKYRVYCLEKLGEHFPVDLFEKTKIEEQLNITSTLLDNSKKISEIKKEILEVSNLVDEMTFKNKDYRISLSETEELIIDTVSMNDMTFYEDVPESIYVEDQRVSDNQVVSIKDRTDKFNMSKVKQKTSSVIKRVNQMMMVSVGVEQEKKIEIVNPELVIINKPLNVIDDYLEDNGKIIGDEILEPSLLGSILLPQELKEEYVENNKEDIIKQEEIVLQEEDNKNAILGNYNSSIFETIDPFEPMSLFVDRSDDNILVLDKNIRNEEIDNLVEKIEEVKQKNNVSTLEEETNVENDMPDAFWVTQSDSIENNNEDILSFDDEITKIKKLVA